MALGVSTTNQALPRAERTAAPGRSRRRRFKSIGTPYLLVAPFLILFLVFFVAPIIYAAYVSLFVNRLIGGQHFVGLANYGQVLTNPDFWDAVRRVATYGVIQVPLTMLVALGLALLLDRRRLRGRTLLQLGYFLPFAIPSVVSALLWGYLYANSFGVFAQFAKDIGLGQPDLLSPSRILFSIGNIALWASAGANMIIYYAVLRSIPAELYEAARIDGASELRVAWHIKLPLLRSSFLFTGILAIIAAFQLFNEPSILSASAPGSITQDYTPNLYAYNLIANAQQYNLAAAVAFTLAVGILVATAAVLLVARRKKS
jgi:multiple sugar transport system permease protein